MTYEERLVILTFLKSIKHLANEKEWDTIDWIGRQADAEYQLCLRGDTHRRVGRVR